MAALADAADLNVHVQRTVPAGQAELALAGASGAVRSYCGWGLLQEDTTFTVEGDGTAVLSLPTLLLNSVSEVRISGTLIPTTGPQPIVHGRGQLFLATGWPRHCKIEVDANHGYDVVPDVVRLVTLTLAARILNNPDSAKSMSVGSVSRTYDASFTQLDMRLLDPYRL